MEPCSRTRTLTYTAAASQDEYCIRIQMGIRPKKRLSYHQKIIGSQEIMLTDKKRASEIWIELSNLLSAYELSLQLRKGATEVKVLD